MPPSESKKKMFLQSLLCITLESNSKPEESLVVEIGDSCICSLIVNGCHIDSVHGLSRRGQCIMLAIHACLVSKLSKNSQS